MQLPVDLSQLTIVSSESEEYSRNPGGIRTSKSAPGHYLTIKAKTRVLLHHDARRFFAFIESIKGNQRIELALPIASEPLGSALGTPKIKTIDTNDKRRLIINGWQNNQIEALSTGDYVGFNGHKKVYRVAECAAVGGDGTAELILTRPLLRPVSVGELVHVRPLFCLGLEGKLPEIQEGNNRPQAYSFTLGEMWWF